MDTHSNNPSGWAAMERWLCVLLVMNRFFDFWKNYDVPFGGDWKMHLQVVEKISWLHPLGVREFFYSYHPPLAFLASKTVMQLTGLNALYSTKILTFACSIGAFLFLRASLKRLHVLSNPAAIAFLYVAASIPMQWTLARAVNLDIFVLFWSSAALYVSVIIALSTDNNAVHSSRSDRCVPYLFLMFILGASLLTKFTGVLLITLPVFVTLAISREKSTACLRMIGVSICAVALVFPYYYTHYYQYEHTFSPSNADWLIVEQENFAREYRDKDKLGFLSAFIFSKNIAFAEGGQRFPQDTLTAVPKLSWTWEHFWASDPYLFFIEPTVVGMTALGLCLFGTTLWLCRQRKHLRTIDLWQRFGWALSGYGFLLLLSLMFYTYKNPYAGWPGNNGVYISACTWTLGYFISYGIVSILPHHRFSEIALFSCLNVVILSQWMM